MSRRWEKWRPKSDRATDMQTPTRPGRLALLAGFFFTESNHADGVFLPCRLLASASSLICQRRV